MSTIPTKAVAPVKSDDPAKLLKEAEQPKAKEKETDAKELKTPVQQPVENRIDEELAKAADARLAEEAKATEGKVAGEDYAVFISPYPTFTVHVTLKNMEERDKNNNVMKTSVPVQFKNGMFRTDNKEVMEQLRTRKQKFSQYYTEVTDMKEAAMMFEGHKARQKHGSVSGGVTTSGDGNTQQMSVAEQHLRQMHETVYNRNVTE